MNDIEYRPWGYFIIISEVIGEFKIKKIVIKPKSRLSLQKHEHRDEKWMICSGNAFVTINEKEYELGDSEFVDIPKGAIHRLENKSENKNLIVIEVATGKIIDESDIIRLEDDYNRIK